MKLSRYGMLASPPHSSTIITYSYFLKETFKCEIEWNQCQTVFGYLRINSSVRTLHYVVFRCMNAHSVKEASFDHSPDSVHHSFTFLFEISDTKCKQWTNTLFNIFTHGGDNRCIVYSIYHVLFDIFRLLCNVVKFWTWTSSSKQLQHDLSIFWNAMNLIQSSQRSC